jgi:flagellar basal-body rod protein FlgF
MGDGMWSALSGAMVQLSTLDVAANNIANASTPAFRAEHAVFREQLARATFRGRPVPAEKQMRYAGVDAIEPATVAGGVLTTGRGLDVAIKGDGFLVVKTPQGDRYTRSGSLQIARDGTLVTHDGNPVLNENQNPLRLPPGSVDAHIAKDGTVFAGGAAVGRLAYVRFPQGSQLAKEGALLYRSDGTNAPAPAQADFETGALEQANVSAVQGMVELVGATRGFEACERAIDAFKEADHRAAMAIMGNG